MIKAVYFDMDGTIADLYSVEGWLADLEAKRARPYREARPMVNMSYLARQLNRIQKKGIKINIISWLSRSGDMVYNDEVTRVKREWLVRHLPSVRWDEIHIVKHGTPKSTCRTLPGILFDDEQRNLDEWGEMAVSAERLMEVLKAL